MSSKLPDSISAQLPPPATRRLPDVPMAREACAIAAGRNLKMGRHYPPEVNWVPDWRLLDDALFHFYPQSSRWVETKAGRCVMPANALMCIPPETPFRHGLGQRKRVNSTYWFRVQGAALPKFFELIRWHPAKPYVQIEESVPFIENWMGMFKTLSVPITAGHLFRLSSITARQLGLIVEAAQQAQYRQQPSNQRVHEVIKYLRDHPTANPSLQELASMANLSTQHLRGIFKQLTGYAPSQYHAQVKAQYAARLLSRTEEPVSIIADQVGFEDPLYFSRWFRRLMGVSPRQYARDHKIRDN